MVIAKIPTTAFAVVVHAYLGSAKFQSLSAATQENYRRHLKVAALEDGLGSVPVQIMRPSLVQKFLDGFADRPGAQTCARVAMKAVERWALPRDLLLFPITTGCEVIGSKGGHEPWTEAQIATAEHYAQPALARAITLAANTGQRGSDLVRMSWSDVETISGRQGINVVQKKTGRRLWVPLTRELAAAMVTWEKRPTPFLLKPSGKPWTREDLTMAWLYERTNNKDLASCSCTVLHGLRATACVRLKHAGANEIQISDMVGLSVQMVKRYTRLSVQTENALAAVYHLDRTSEERTVRLAEKNRA